MRIALYFDDSGFENLMLKNPEQGNNGVGGTQFCFLMLIYELIKHTEHSVIVYHYHNNELPEGICDHIITNWEEMLGLVRQESADIFVFKADDKMARLDLMREYNLNCVAWAHNYLLADKLNELAKNEAIKRVVFVGKEHYDRYIDHNVIEKSTYIFNMYASNIFDVRPMPNEKSVTYTGSLVPGKGFHVLAKVWKDILREVPEAQLYVIGNGQLYNRNSRLGSLSIADEKYEKVFSAYLMEKEKLLPSVHFLGTLGEEKIEIYKKTKVGIMNPSGVTETFGLSAVEMEACGIPVITRAKNGLYDTVKNGRTGFLIKTENELKQRIIKLLNDDTLNDKLGRQAKVFVEESFDPQNLVRRWEKLFIAILNNEEQAYYKPTCNYLNNQKWLHLVVRCLRKIGLPIMPLANIDYWVRKILKRV